MDEAERGLQELLVDRLAADGVPGRVADLVLAAWEGEASLTTAVAGGHYTGIGELGSGRPGRRGPEVFLGAVHVEGFRGVGELATLPLRAGPGLTLVTGRNGSGKSSFAEAAELALTGSSARWSSRTAVWREGWRNLHTTGSTRVAVDLIVSGQVGTTSIARRWGSDDGLDDGQWTRQRHGQQVETFDGSDWGEDMGTYRPFLSYGELGALIDGRPSDLHDALHSLLGLGPLSTTQDRLRTKAKQLSDEVKSVGADRRAIRDACLGVGDERAQRAAALLKPTSPDLDAVAVLALGTDEDAAETTALRRITALELPEATTVDAAVTSIRQASGRHTALATAENCAAHDVAALVRAALHHHNVRGDGPCPVCGEGTLDVGWRAQAQQRADAMEYAAAELRDATASLETAMAQARDLVRPVPTSLTHTAPVDTSAAREAWQYWSDAVRSAQPEQLADALTGTHPAALRVLTELQQRAVQELSHRDETWRPLAGRLAAWHDDATRVAKQTPLLTELQDAEKWLAGAAAKLRDQRLAPFAEASQRVWQRLRQQSNVDLGPVRLEGSKTRRRVAMDVRVDGVDGGAALAVMSQGELHALGLSLFLPRATVDHSPFRFVMIDDPVQAMDPAKVDGLAQVLAEVAQHRQVIVFTHDDRLTEAVRRLQLPATVWEVQRRERSAVALRRSDDPVGRYLADARALAATDQLPDDLRSELVASCCRSAIEAACHARIRTVRLARGETHLDVEELLARPGTTHQMATLAVFDDPRRASDLLDRLRRDLGPWAVDALQACKKGAHSGLRGDLRPLIRDAKKLATWIGE